MIKPKHKDELMRQVPYAEYLGFLGFKTYKFKHFYGPNQHTTDVYDGAVIVGKIVRGETTKYFIFEKN